MNQVEEQFEPEAIRPSAGDYFVVGGNDCSWHVSTEMARFIEECLDAEPRPVWIRFVDLTGARIRVRSRMIDWVWQSTVAQRELDRMHWRKLRREDRKDRDWDDD